MLVNTDSTCYQLTNDNNIMMMVILVVVDDDDDDDDDEVFKVPTSCKQDVSKSGKNITIMFRSLLNLLKGISVIVQKLTPRTPSHNKK